jgi:hypothetical protein
MSQIISEMLEYTVLYTYNVVQKHKSWNDGKLKYYKFNNKVQVHTLCGVLVTEQFMRNTIHLQNGHWGESFKVGSILVQIEELISEAQRDIAPVFRKDHKTRAPGAMKIMTVPLKQLTEVSSPSVARKRRVGLSRSETPSKRRQLDTARPSTQSRSLQGISSSSSTCSTYSACSLHKSQDESQSVPMLQKTMPHSFKDIPVSTRSSRSLRIASVTPRTEKIVPSVIATDGTKSPIATSISSSESSKSPESPITVSQAPLPHAITAIPTATHSSRPLCIATTPIPKKISTPNSQVSDPISGGFQESGQAAPSPVPQGLAQPHRPSRIIKTPRPKVYIPSVTLKSEPAIMGPLEEDEPSISWGTQENPSLLASRLQELHQVHVMNTPITTPRPRIRAQQREAIRVSEPVVSGRSIPKTPGRTPLQPLQQNSSKRLIQRFETPYKLTPMQTPISSKDKVQVYASDSEYEEDIVETQLKFPKDLEKITQTETYDYGKDAHHRVSNLRF